MHRLLTGLRVRPIGAVRLQAAARWSSTDLSAPHDVVIVGGGIVGAALACRIAESPILQGKRVAVVENQPPPALADVAKLAEPDLRTFAITPSSKAVLEAAGAWQLMERVRAPAFHHMQVWEALGPGYVRFHAEAAQQAQLGWIMENRVMQSALYEKMKEHAAAGRLTLLCPASVAKLRLPPATDGPVLPATVPQAAGAFADPTGGVHDPNELAEITLGDGRKLRTRLVVGADGAASRVRDAAKIGTWGHDYDQRAVVATVRTGGHDVTAWQRFLPNGPVAILPLWEDYASIVWSTTPAHAEALVAAPPQVFADALNAVLTASNDEFQQALRGEAAPVAVSSAAPAASGSAGPSATSGTPTGDAAHESTLYNRSTDAIWLDPVASLVRLGGGVSDHLASSTWLQRDAFVPPPHITAVVGARASFPLRWSKANAYVRPRLALVGDAAHTVHPLAGQGLNLGLTDADELARVLASGAYAGADPGSLSLLRSYERTRAAHNLMMMTALDSVKRVFTSQLGGTGPAGISAAALGLGTDGAESRLLDPWIIARNVGMSLLNACGPLKAQVAKYAMGGR